MGLCAEGPECAGLQQKKDARHEPTLHCNLRDD
jgi:hypothetical protein